VDAVNGLEDMLLELVLIEALHDEAERLARAAAPSVKPQEGARGGRFRAWEVEA
jgi:hypothetical protein